jgi:hypothetical protein
VAALLANQFAFSREMASHGLFHLFLICSGPELQIANNPVGPCSRGSVWIGTVMLIFSSRLAESIFG